MVIYPRMPLCGDLNVSFSTRMWNWSYFYTPRGGREDLRKKVKILGRMEDFSLKVDIILSPPGRVWRSCGDSWVTGGDDAITKAVDSWAGAAAALIGRCVYASGRRSSISTATSCQYLGVFIKSHSAYLTAAVTFTATITIFKNDFADGAPWLGGVVYVSAASASPRVGRRMNS